MTTMLSPTDPAKLPGARPFVGHLPDLRRDPLGLVQRCASLGPVTAFDMGPRGQAFLVSHPDGVKRVMLDAQPNYSKQTRGFATLRDVLGRGLLTAEGDYWRKQRRIAQPAFHHKQVERFAAIMTNATAERATQWWSRADSGAAFDVFEEMMQLTLQIVGECLFSTDPTDESSEIGGAIEVILHKFMKRITSPFALPLSWPMPGHAQLRDAIGTLHRIVDDIIADRRKAASSQAVDLLDLLMAVEDETTGERLSDQQLRDEVLTLLVAGHETTASALAWTWSLLSQHPHIDRRLHTALAGLGDHAPRLSDVQTLGFVGQVIREGMRLYPPVWMLARHVEADDELCGVRVPRDSLVFLSPYATHRNPELFSNPELFDPDRFAPNSDPGRPTTEYSKFAYFPFGAGPRICIGSSFALMEAQIILAGLRKQFKLRLARGAPIPDPQLTLRARGGIWMTAHAHETAVG